jgi:quinol monooxygenase YgiN
MMIVYEVTLEVDAAIADDYRAWLAEHVAAMLALPGFVDARTFDVLQPELPEGRVGFCVHYRLHDEAALERYLAEHAGAMRDAGRQRFGDAFNATRRVLRPVQAD